MIGTLIVLIFMFFLCRYMFKKDYEQIKRARKAMEMWDALDEDYEEEEEETKEVTKRNG